MTTEVMAFNTARSICAAHDAEAAPLGEDVRRAAARVFIEAAFRGAGKPLPEVMDGRAYLQAQFLAKGKPIPAYLLTGQAAPTRAAAQAAVITSRIVPESDPFAGRQVTRVFIAPNGELVKQIRVGEEERRMLALPTPADAALAEAGPDQDGAARGDAKIMRRRRATELERLLKDNRKRALAKSPTSAVRERWDLEYQELSAELAAIREAERIEREQYTQF